MWFSPLQTRYLPVGDSHETAAEQDKAPVLTDGWPANQEHYCGCSRRSPRWPAVVWTLCLTFTCSILFVAYASGILFRSPSCKSSSTDRECAKKTSSFSPVLDAIEYYDLDYLNAFTQTSIYRGPPSPELDKAWLDLWLFEGISVPSYGLPLLNRSESDKNRYVRVAPEYGDGYMAIVEVFHQLHCLDTIRQYTWWLLGKYTQEQLSPSLEYSEKGKRMHVDHCIETLRISLMCQADVSPVLVMRDHTTPHGQRADFNSHHRCRNFTKIQEWAKEHAVRGYHVGEHNHAHDHD